MAGDSAYEPTGSEALFLLLIQKSTEDIRSLPVLSLKDGGSGQARVVLCI